MEKLLFQNRVKTKISAMVFLGEKQEHPQGNRLTRKENGMTDLTARPIRAGPHL